MQAPRIHTVGNFTRQDLIQLADIDGQPCISLYMPTELATATADEARIRLKNLLRRAENKVSEAGKSQKKVLLPKIEEGRRLMADENFWRRRSEGLAIFITPDQLRYYQLPVRFEESVTLGNRFRVKPLMPLFMADGRFYVLALSQAAIRLLDCTRHRAVELEAEDIPGGIDETLAYDSKQTQLQYHTGAGQGFGARSAMFHGHGVSIDDQKDEIRRYFQRVDHALRPLLDRPEIPLVLAGVDYLLPIYREVTNYGWILEEVVTGNPDSLSAEELHQKALAVVRPELERQQQQALARYRELAGVGHTAAGVQSVVPAAVNGRVDTLFVSLEEFRPGTFDPATNQATVSREENPEAEDLLDLATVQTIRHDGKVYALENAAMPAKDAAAAAILRF
jgi:hypothetical protein